MKINRLAILGLGLMGGSLALAAKKRGLVKEVVAWGRSEERLAKGKSLGVIDSYSLQLSEVIEGADIIVIATPVLHAERLIVELFSSYKTQAIVTDVGSTKGNLLNAVKVGAGYVPENLVLAHPIAGAETSGVEAATDSLYEHHRVIVTPTQETNTAALETITQLWQAVGAEVINMTVEQHDKVLAATSHLPHFLAYAIMDTLCSMENEQEVFRFAAGGFRDFTRIAKSSPSMWHDIALANKKALLESIDEFTDHLAQLRQAIAEENSDVLYSTLEHVAQTRKNLHDNVLPKKKNK